MNILYTTNDGFVGKVATGICSVFENNMDLPELTVYIIGQEISEKNKKKFTYNQKNPTLLCRILIYAKPFFQF